MRASLERTGGFAGMRLTATVDSDTLGDNDAKRFEQLVESSDFFRLPAQLAPQKPQPDRFQYTLTIENNGDKHTVTASEAALPANVRPLIDWLTRIARRG
ncbi:MAG: hypothetical protein M1434_03330 [Chloroflexi bacterium]|nr:hypothetical protein [Chloroflexota bacterium]MCL5273762.1 hypothetical protein [Chloroflexota bacterium]